MKEKSVLPRRFGASLPLLAVLVIAAPAFADFSAYLSAPTGVRSGDVVPLMGSHFPANVVVHLIVTEPLGQQVDSYVLVDADGRMNYPLVTSQSGNYQIQARDQAGNALAGASVMAAGD